MSYTVVPVANRRELGDFLRLPFRLYRGDPLWVPSVAAEVGRTLDPGRNPYFAGAALRLFVCYRDGIPVARLSAVVDPAHERAFGVRAGFFGFFESENDGEAARRVFGEAEAFCRARGASVLEGPFNPHHYSELGLQMDRFGTAPTFFQPYNPAHYRGLLEGAGFRASVHLQTMANDDAAGDLGRRFGALAAASVRDGYAVRPFSLRDRARDMEVMREINNEAFAENWPFVPLSREEYAFSAKHMGLVTRPGLIKFVEHRGRPVAVLHCVLDVNPLLRRWRGSAGPLKLARFMWGRRTARTIVLFTVAIRKDYRRSYVSRLLLAEFCRMARHFERAETTWLSPGNRPALRSAESLGMRPDKRFAVFAKELGP
jgi:hypothetical protein